MQIDQDHFKYIINIHNIMNEKEFDGLKFWILTFLADKRNVVLTINDLMYDCCTTIVEDDDGLQKIKTTLINLSEESLINYDRFKNNSEISIKSEGIFLYRQMKECFDKLVNDYIEKLSGLDPKQCDTDLVNSINTLIHTKTNNNLEKLKEHTKKFILNNAMLAIRLVSLLFMQETSNQDVVDEYIGSDG